MPRRLSGQVVAVAVAALLLVATFVTFRSEPDTRTVSAHFSRAVSIYAGSEVRVLGVPIGSVERVVPEGNSVRVDMTYDAKYKVPSTATAVIVTPTLVADRFVQLTPAYDGGKLLADGATIAVEDTGTPVELDRIYASLKDLSNALGPSGANRDGSLNTLLAAGTKALDGQGARGNAMIKDLSQASQTFANGSGDLFDTVDQLSQFTTVLAENDRVVRSFIEDLSGVSGQLSQEREELRAVLAALADSVGVVQRFVRQNRGNLSASLKALEDVTGAVAAEKQGLALAVEKGPLGAGNLALAFDNPTGSIGGRFAIGGNADDVDGVLCAVVTNADIANKELACKLFEALLERLPQGAVPPNQDTAPGGGGQAPGTPGVPSLPGVPNLPQVGGGAPATSLQELLGGGGR